MVLEVAAVLVVDGSSSRYKWWWIVGYFNSSSSSSSSSSGSSNVILPFALSRFERVNLSDLIGRPHKQFGRSSRPIGPIVVSPLDSYIIEKDLFRTTINL